MLCSKSVAILRCEVRIDRLHKFSDTIALFLIHNMKIGEREDRLDIWHLVAIHQIPYIVTHEEQFTLRVVDNMYNVVAIKVLKDRHNHRTISYNCQIRQAPARVISTHECNLITMFNAYLIE